MNILDGSWMSLSKTNLFHQVVNNSDSKPPQIMNSLDRSANGFFDSMFYLERKAEESYNDSMRFFNQSNNLNDSSKLLDTSIRSTKSRGFQPYQQKQEAVEINEKTRMPALCIATKMQQSQAEEQEESSASEKSEFVVNNFKIHHDDSGQGQTPNKKNQTKNIPKNYGKAIISFMQKNRDKIVQLMGGSVNEIQIMAQLKNRKRSINTIKDIRDLWIKSKFAKEFRMISNLFLRKHAFEYIFNSRITNYSSHIKYRHKLRQAVKSPQTFICIKDKEY